MELHSGASDNPLLRGGDESWRTSRSSSSASSDIIEDIDTNIGGSGKLKLSSKTKNLFNINTPDGNDPSSDIKAITIAYPLPSKDPLIAYRSMYNLTQELKISSKTIVKQVLAFVLCVIFNRSLQGGAFKSSGGKFSKELLKPVHSFPWDAENKKEMKVCLAYIGSVLLL